MPADGLLRHVNPLQGTDSHPGFSRGNTLPILARPFGMAHWSAQTAEGRWFFSPRDRQLQGVRLTHQPSPWMGDYGAVTFLPQSGERRLSARARSTSYVPSRTAFGPHRFETDLLATGDRIELVPTERGAILRATFADGAPARLIVDPAAGESSFWVEPDGRTIVGFTRGNSGGVPEGFAEWIVAECSVPIVSSTAFVGNAALDGTEPGERYGLCAEFGPAAGPVEIRIATSFIDAEQARRNLEIELRGSFEAIAADAERVWEETLGRIRVESDDTDRLTTFYSCLYRTQLFPRIWHEPDTSSGEDGAMRHRSPYDGGVHPGVLYTDNGFWDTYRTEYPLLALVWPDRLAEILRGWVHALKEGGWFPQWATPGYRACMVGTHIDAVIADAVSRGITGFDVEAAAEGMLRHAYHPGDPDGAWGRIGIEDYIRLGYVPADRHHESVARTLDYAYDDWCLARVLRGLGRGAEAEALEARSGNYRNLWDPEVGFMRGRNADGSWLEPWREFGWGSPYVEGGPWQSVWAVPHDPMGLAALMGGPEALVAKLDQMLTTPPRFEIGVYGLEIHEMTEMACADPEGLARGEGFGQYAHSNQPVHHALWLYAAMGRPDRTATEVRRVLDRLYTPDDLPGDEDNGEMGAWYVLSALGLFASCPGDGRWTLGAPVFARATVTPESGGRLAIEASDVSAPGAGVPGVAWNGTAIEGRTLAHRAIAAGGTLRFEAARTLRPDPNPRPTV